MELLTIRRAGFFELEDSGNHREYLGSIGSIHMFEYEVTLRSRTHNRLFHAIPDDIQITPPGAAVRYDAEVPGRHICLHFDVADGRFDLLVPELTYVRPGDDGSTYRADLRRILEDHHSSDHWRRMAAASGLQALLYRLYAQHSRQVASPLTRAQQAVIEARDHIEANLGQPLRVDELAAQVGLDANYLGLQFRRRYEITIRQYILKRRLEEARFRLQDSNQPIKAIALELGFSDVHHLYHRFRRYYHDTPNAVREAGSLYRQHMKLRRRQLRKGSDRG